MAGPISEDDFFTWEALINGPKDTPFVSTNLYISFKFLICLYHRRVAFSSPD